jgi:manganese-transporting P-type ATPase
MITGDNTLTATHVATELKIVDKPILILQKNGDGGLQWNNIISKKLFSFDIDLKDISNDHCFCIEGNSLAYLAIHDLVWFSSNVKYISIFSRVSPDQKELIITSLKSLKYTTLMCGDGTNDVGALKQAEVGVALLNDISDKDWGLMLNKKTISPMSTKDTKSKMEEEEVPVVRLGDASIASPFTSKASSILSTSHIIRQGRCTLVTTMQMFRILAINSLISAYSMSVLHLDGIYIKIKKGVKVN